MTNGKNFRSGFVGLIGYPNSGKSTLANHLIGEKFSIVSHKPQTTRKRIFGILNSPTAQVILTDAPGVIEKTAGLNEFIQEEVSQTLKNMDAYVVVLSIDGESPEAAKKLIDLVQAQGKPWAVVITKVDLPLVHRVSILSMMVPQGTPVYPVSVVSAPQATKDILLPLMESLVPESSGPMYDDEDLYTTQSQRELVQEILREKCFECLHQEIPYGLTVLIRKWDDENVVTKIHADVIVERSSHKKMVVGAEGKVLKRIGTCARVEIEKLVGHQVFLDLHAVVKEKWTRDPHLRAQYGYRQEVPRERRF